MNKSTELERKFRAQHVNTLAFDRWCRRQALAVARYTHAVGTDTFFASHAAKADGGAVVRFRRATTSEGNSPPTFTYKQRQRPGDILDRVEIDVALNPEKTSIHEGEAFLKAIGMTEHFSLVKESFIYHFNGQINDNDLTRYEVVVALYDVFENDLIHRFIEIEVDKHSLCTDDQGLAVLKSWVDDLQYTLAVGEALETSLYEMFAPRDALFIPESF